MAVLLAMMMETEEKLMKIIAVCGVIIIALVLSSGCTQPFDAASGQAIPEEIKNNSLLTPTVMARGTTVTVSTPPATREPTKTQTTKPTMTLTSLTITPQSTPDSASYICNGDTCGTLNIQITCNPRILFKRVAILQIKNPNNTTVRSAAVAAMGNNFADVLPDGSVIPIKINPGKYTLVLLDEKNAQVPETGGILSLGTVSVSTDKTTTFVFKEKC
jgi:hypothetical protein